MKSSAYSLVSLAVLISVRQVQSLLKEVNVQGDVNSRRPDDEKMFHSSIMRFETESSSTHDWIWYSTYSADQLSLIVSILNIVVKHKLDAALGTIETFFRLWHRFTFIIILSILVPLKF